ncbi:hypothetical protein RK720_09575, partial [Streptococcus pneumoniae]|nr:hypothetical protein [Streptococcus pneumoniae]
KKHPLGEKRNHPGSKLRQGFWMVFRFGVNNWGFTISTTSKQGFELSMANFLVCSLAFHSKVMLSFLA